MQVDQHCLDSCQIQGVTIPGTLKALPETPTRMRGVIRTLATCLVPGATPAPGFPRGRAENVLCFMTSASIIDISIFISTLLEKGQLVKPIDQKDFEWRLTTKPKSLCQSRLQPPVLPGFCSCLLLVRSSLSSQILLHASLIFSVPV